MLFKVDPITFERYPAAENAYNELVSEIERRGIKVNPDLSGLRKFNDFIYDLLTQRNLWESIPSDTRFPGYFSSLSDHAIATASIAVPLAVEMFKKGYDLASEYDGEIKDVLSSERGVIEVCRTLSLLHDVGKHPPKEHHVRTREYVEKILNMVGLESFSKAIAESASRHHYRYTMDAGYQPRTKLEWIVAFADKISSTLERGVLGEFTRLLEPYKWLRRLETDERTNRVVEFIESVNSNDLRKVESLINDETIYSLIPVNFEKTERLDEKIFNASKTIGDVKLGIFCMEVAGINKFVTASDYRKYISGSSALIDCTLDKVRAEIEKMLSPECVIYAKGGSLLAMIPPYYFGKIRERACQIFEEETKVVDLKLPSEVEFELWELKYGPRIYRIYPDTETSLKLAEKRNFGSIVSAVIDSLEIDERVNNPEEIPLGGLCPLCHEYRKSDRKHLIDDKEEEVCERCHLVLEKDEEVRGEKWILNIDLENDRTEIPAEVKPNTSYARIIKRIERILTEKLKTSEVVAEYKLNKVRRINFVPVKTWNCLGRQHTGKDYPLEECDEIFHVAFIKGDGDNFGKIKSEVPSITLYRQISTLFEEVIEGCIAEALAEVMIKQLEIRVKREVKDTLMLELPFDIVFVGGDDFLILIDAAFLFTFLKSFRKSLQKKLGERKDRFDKKESEPLSVIPLGVSMGIAVVKNRMPIKSTVDAVNDLLSKSKRKSKNETGGFGGEIYVALKKFDSIPTRDEIEEVFGESNGKRLTQFPMNGKILSEFIEDLKFFVERDVSPNWIKSVLDCRKSPVDSYVDFLYKLARTDKGAKEREVLEKINELHKSELGDGGNFTFKHIDIAESIEIVRGKLDMEGMSADVKEIMLKLLGE